MGTQSKPPKESQVKLSNILNNDVLICFGKALFQLMNNDSNLLVRRVKEEAINHRLAVYLENIIKSNNDNSHISVDVEYNKNYDKRKEITYPDGTKVYFRPDILVHQRGDNYNNKLAIECKIDYMDKKTIEKLKGMKREPYFYDNSIGIVYRPQIPNVFLYIASDTAITKHTVPKSEFKLYE